MPETVKVRNLDGGFIKDPRTMEPLVWRVMTRFTENGAWLLAPIFPPITEAGGFALETVSVVRSDLVEVIA